MVHPVTTGIDNSISSSIEQTRLDTQQKPSTSFDEILQQKSGQKEVMPTPPPAKALTPLDQIREELTLRITGLKAGNPDGLVTLDPGARQSLISGLFNSLDKQSFATDLQTLLTDLESKWSQLTAISESGEKLSQSELLSLQAQVYDLSEEIALLSKLVDELTGGVKTILRTSG